MSDKILQIVDEENGTDQQLPVKYLSEIITARVREIVDAVLYLIQESGYADRLRNGVVLTGGCANLAGCANLIKEMSGYNVRIGFPRARKFSFSGCAGIGETDAVSTVSMLLHAREDKHLNCIEEVSQPKASPQAESEPVEESVFDQVEPEVNKEKKKIKAKPEPRPARDNFFVRWTKKSLKAGEDFVGGLYDKLEEN